MKRFPRMMWTGVAVLGLVYPVFSDAAGPNGNNGSKGGPSRGGGSNAPGGNSTSMKFSPQTGGQSSQVFKPTPVVNTGPKFGQGSSLVRKDKPFPILVDNKGGGGKPPILDPGIGNGGKPPVVKFPGKFPGKFDPFPGGKPPVIDPGNGGKPPKPPVFDPFPGGKPPVFDPGNGHGHGHHHHPGHHHPWWPKYGLSWCWPTYYSQPYCGTVYVNGCWIHTVQPVAAQQISLLSVGNSLPEIPSAATFKMQVSGLSPQQGVAAVEVNGVGMQAELLEWNADSVVVKLPAVGLTQPATSQLHILRSDGSLAKTLPFKMLPALDAAVAQAN